MKIQKDLGFDDSDTLGFVNTDLERDALLFVDPNFIRTAKVPSFDSQRAYEKIQDFFKHALHLFSIGKKREAIATIMSVHENNDIHFGFSHGLPKGKGPSPEAIWHVFERISELEKPVQDKMASPLMLLILVPRFGPDALSDLLGNIIFDELYEYSAKTLESLGKLNKGVNAKHVYWDNQGHQWVTEDVPDLCTPDGGQSMLLVPTRIATKMYTSTASDYVFKIILIAQRQAEIDKKGRKDALSKKDLYKQNTAQSKYTDDVMKNYALDETIKHPEYMQQNMVVFWI